MKNIDDLEWKSGTSLDVKGDSYISLGGHDGSKKNCC